MKKFCACLLLLLLLCGSALAYAMVVDDAHLFTADEIAAMERLIQTIRTTYQMDAAVLTTTDTPYDPSEDVDLVMRYAHAYYDNNGYGLGDDRAGLLYMIDMHNRVPVISTNGLMIDYITDRRLEALFDESAPYLRQGEYGQAAVSVLSRLTEQLRQGREAGSFRYDKETGKRLSGLYNPLTEGEITLAVIGGLTVMLMLISRVRKGYQLRGTTYRYAAKDLVQKDMIEDTQVMTDRRVTRSLRPTSSGNYRGGGGRFGGGGSFGGGFGSGVSGGHGGGHGGRF